MMNGSKTYGPSVDERSSVKVLRKEIQKNHPPSSNGNPRIIFTKVQEFAVMTTLLGKEKIRVRQSGGHAARAVATS